MRTMERGWAGAVLLLVGLTGAAHAQGWRFDAGMDLGGAWRSASVAPAQTGSAAGMSFRAGPVADLQLGARLLPRLGVRANAAFSRDAFSWGGVTQYDRVNLWSASADLLLALRAPAAAFTGREFLPYLALGAGVRFLWPVGVAVGALDGTTVVDGVVVGSAARPLLLQRARAPMGLVGLGGDLRFSPRLALRLEVGDRVFEPPVDRVTGAPAYSVLDRDVGRLTHELYATAGLHVLLGLPGPPAVAKAAPEPPATPIVPLPPPAPAPAAPPAEEARPVTFCVIDPAAAGGMRLVEGLYLPETADTVVVVEGARRALRTAFADRIVLADQDWYNHGQPLAFGPAARPVRFMAAGTPRSLQPGTLAYLGRAGGLPVFAEPTPAASLGRLLARLGPDADLTALSLQRSAVLQQLRTLQTLYVPAARTGCVLQPLQRQEIVRKVRG